MTMKSKFILAGISLSLFTISSLPAQTTYEIEYWDQPRYPPYDKVKKRFYVEVYGKDSLLLERADYYSANDSAFKKITFEYNSKKQKIKETERIWSSVQTRHFVYNDSGVLSRMYYSHMDKAYGTIESTESYFFNSLGALVKKEITSEHYPYPKTWTYTYEQVKDKKKVTERLYYYRKKKPRYKKETLFNAKGLVVSEREKGRKANYAYVYDEKGEWVIKKACVYERASLRQCGEYRKKMIK